MNVETCDCLAGEKVVATIEESLPTGERYDSTVVIGCYPNTVAPEVWIGQGENRVQFSAAALPAVIKQLKRAVSIAKEVE